MVPRAHLALEFDEGYFNEPAIFVPQRARLFGERVAGRGCRADDNTDGADLLLSVREDNVPRLHLEHELIEGVLHAVLFDPGRPHVVATDLLFERLVLVHPPVVEV